MKLLLLLLVCPFLFASTVTHTGVTLRHLLVSQEADAPFQEKEYLCVVQGGEEVACGFVEKVEERGVLVDLEFRAEDVRIGSLVQRAKTRRPCDPNFKFRPLQDPRFEKPLQDPYSRGCSEKENRLAERFRLPANSYVSLGVGIVNPRLAGEVGFMDILAVGLSVDAIQFYESLPSLHAKASGFAYGGTVFLSYYPLSPLEKLQVQLGVGYRMGRLTLRDHLQSWTGLVTVLKVGYRFLEWQNFGIGFSLGADHYAFNESETGTRTEFLYPNFLIEFGAGI